MGSMRSPWIRSHKPGLGSQPGPDSCDQSSSDRRSSQVGADGASHMKVLGAADSDRCAHGGGSPAVSASALTIRPRSLRGLGPVRFSSQGQHVYLLPGAGSHRSVRPGLCSEVVQTGGSRPGWLAYLDHAPEHSRYSSTAVHSNSSSV